MYRKARQPGVFDTPVILNLHLLLWDSYISNWMSGLRFAVEGRRLAADTHLALLGVKIQEPAFWVFAKEEFDKSTGEYMMYRRCLSYKRYHTAQKSGEVQKICSVPKRRLNAIQKKRSCLFKQLLFAG